MFKRKLDGISQTITPSVKNSIDVMSHTQATKFVVDNPKVGQMITLKNYQRYLDDRLA